MSRTTRVLYWLLMGLIIYVGLAELVFAFRHPWATSTERFLYTGTALTFSHVEYKDARPRN